MTLKGKLDSPAAQFLIGQFACCMKDNIIISYPKTNITPCILILTKLVNQSMKFQIYNMIVKCVVVVHVVHVHLAEYLLVEKLFAVEDCLKQLCLYHQSIHPLLVSFAKSAVII